MQRAERRPRRTLAADLATFTSSARDRLEERRVVLAAIGALIAVQWIVVVGFALSTPHTGWLWGLRQYQGPDNTHYYTSAWVLGQGQIPQAELGYAWQLLVAPVARLAGPDIFDAMQPIVLLHVLVLVPLVTCAVYVIAASVGGRVFGVVSAGAWVVLPVALIPFWDERYHDHWTDQLVPHLYGLLAQGDFPSLVFVTVSAAFAFRALDQGGVNDALVAGAFAGFAVGVKPANLLFVAAPLLAFAIARRWPAVAAFGAAMLPALLALGAWKARGLPEFPLAYNELHLAASATPEASGALDRLRSYIRVDWDHLEYNRELLREYFWSERILGWSAIAGGVAAARLSLAKGVFLVTWLGMYLVFKGATPQATLYYSGTFLRLILPALPAFFVLAASTVLLVPALARRVRPAKEQFGARTSSGAAATAIGILGVVPLVALLVLPVLNEPRAVNEVGKHRAAFVPVSSALTATAERAGRAVDLRWDPSRAPEAATFIIYRGPPLAAHELAEFRGQPCPEHPSCISLSCSDAAPSATKCTLEMMRVGRSRTGSFRDEPPPGQWTYRVAAAYRYTDEPSGAVERGAADPYLIGPPVSVRTRS